MCVFLLTSKSLLFTMQTWEDENNVVMDEISENTCRNQRPLSEMVVNMNDFLCSLAFSQGASI